MEDQNSIEKKRKEIILTANRDESFAIQSEETWRTRTSSCKSSANLETKISPEKCHVVHNEHAPTPFPPFCTRG